MHIATINSIRLHYAESGDPAGAPVVFANSLGTDLRVWDRLLALLPPELRILRYDMRGHGLSDAPPGDYSMLDLVADAAGLIPCVEVPEKVAALITGFLKEQGIV